MMYTPLPKSRARSAGRKRLEEEANAALEQARVSIREHYCGKRRASIERTFQAIADLVIAEFASRGARGVRAERRWLSERAGINVRTFDAAVRALEALGLITVERTRIKRAMNRANRWSLAGSAAVAERADRPNPARSNGRLPDPRILHSRTNTYTNRTPVDSQQRSVRKDLYSGLRARANPPQTPHYWGDVVDIADHPALVGMAGQRRRFAADAYELVRGELLGAGAVRVPEGGWLRAIRDWLLDADELTSSPNLGDVRRMLDGLMDWWSNGGALAYSFAWMHKYRGCPSPPPSLVFGRIVGDSDDHSEGATPFEFWTRRGDEIEDTEAAWELSAWR